MTSNAPKGRCLSLFEAWEMIPRFNGNNAKHVDGFINAVLYVAEHIDPAHKPDLLRAILETKIQEAAKTNLASKEITTFEKLKAELMNLYRVKRSISTIKYEWKNCRQKRNESVAEYSQRFMKLMKELITVSTNATRSQKLKRSIPKFIRGVALNYFIDGLRPVYKKTGDRGYPDLPDAIMRAMNEEKMEKHPHLANLQCNWCGDRGHQITNCYQRLRHERKLRYRGLLQRSQPMA